MTVFYQNKIKKDIEKITFVYDVKQKIFLQKK